jgi:hypothetical protein
MKIYHEVSALRDHFICGLVFHAFELRYSLVELNSESGVGEWGPVGREGEGHDEAFYKGTVGDDNFVVVDGFGHSDCERVVRWRREEGWNVGRSPAFDRFIYLRKLATLCHAT